MRRAALRKGDEIGLAGANDPDCRRVMPAEDELSDHQRQVRDTTRQLARLRLCSTALRRGDREVAVVTGQDYAYLRGRHLDHPVVVLVTTRDAATTIELPPAAVPAGDYVDFASGESFTVSSGTASQVSLPALSFRVLVRADDPCREGK